jgi:S-adenosylmethionine hydrolase
MPVITLTTDLGYNGFYVAAIKGSIISQLPDTQVVDVTHAIPSYNIAEAAFTLKNAYPYFPAGSIHMVCVDNNYDPNARFVAVLYDGHYFLGPDNGLFSLMMDKKPELIFKIGLRLMNDPQHFPIRDILAKAAVHLAKGGKMELIGRKMSDMNYRTVLQPIIQPDLIRGSVIYVDSFSNVITNITKPVYQEVGKDRPFTIVFKRSETIEEISNSYSDVPEGEKLCLFGITGNLEIAINKGKASGLLGLHLGDIITVQFQ